MTMAFLSGILAATASIIILATIPVYAAQYEIFIDVENEDDLDELLIHDEISEETYDILLDMLQRGVDLNRAPRRELYSLPNLTYKEVDSLIRYRGEAGGITDLNTLVRKGVIPGEKLKGIAPFVIIRDPGRPVIAAAGRIQCRTFTTKGEEGAPPMAIRARLNLLRHLTAGVAGVLTRNRPGEVAYDPNRRALAAYEPTTDLLMPKYYILWEGDRYETIAGTYRIGFGQGLTLDNSSRYTPDGFYADKALIRDTTMVLGCKESIGELYESPCAGEGRHEYTTPDFRWQEGFRGASAGIKSVEIGSGTLQVYGFYSLQSRSIYQYEIYNKALCKDPREDEDPDCAAPAVYLRKSDPLERTGRFSYYTLPDMFNEQLYGGNISYYFNRRTHMGLTGYRASVDWLIEGMELDFQEWSRYPFGGPFGAVGMDASWGASWSDLSLELTRAFDSMDDKEGGDAALIRHTSTWGKQEFELALWWYETAFANPYSRAVSEADEFEGLRARDEAGLRLRYSGKVVPEFRMRTSIDIWRQLSEDTDKMRLYLLGDYEVFKWFTPGLLVKYQDKDLTKSGRMGCFEVSSESDGDDGPVKCGGEKMQGGIRSRFDFTKRYYLRLQYNHTFIDDDRYSGRFRQDRSFWLAFTSKPTKALRLRFRLRHLNEDISDNRYLEQSLRSSIDSMYRFGDGWILGLRYDLRLWLDSRESTKKRRPSPEHWLGTDIEYRF